MSNDGYYASSRDDAPPPAPHSATSGFNEPAAPTAVHSMADSNGLMARTHVVVPSQLQGDEDQAMSDEDRSHSSSALNLAQASVMDIVKEGKRVIAAFLKETPCYDVIKNSGKVVVFDVKIPINLAFFALVEHDIKSVPIWDAEQGKFVGMFTATDFVNILRHFYIRGSPMNELAEHSIASWRAIPRSLSMAPTREEMVSVTPEHNMYEVCKMLRDNRLHRLPVVDPTQNSVLSVITHSGILEYLVATFREQRRLFDQPIFDLDIGVYSGFVTVPEDMPLIRVLHTLIERRVSAVPIVDPSGVVVNIYCVSNVTELVKDRSLTQLDMPVGEILRIQAAEGNVGEGLHLCYKTDTLHMIFERFAACKAHRERNYRVYRARRATDDGGQTDKMEMKHRAASDDRRWARESREQDEHKQIKQHTTLKGMTMRGVAARNYRSTVLSHLLWAQTATWIRAF
ncbi:hypothetical protein PF005_g20097 [Phytophthora fragariae]|uniref:CBS domain-containing protein n=1 Tax=Phytophthora fragariae TaxID=53985 RepID=A0A6A3E8V2_9STRA|nr:hypothetical protein PF009_g20984 [Phytophthora fragariae]KAE8989203.1 hypothetical protein PF011_g18872 [Phytophthora fragariae]KAE9088089.1 hypothetical protein PF007_g20113 [Phytophthora fragariae]KAE9088176.1 hypothetical protein PF010_g19464 [Phytophthora fragariae]KAE9117353.1 hypothetical protein PF006_g18834 [Phytophthora fragariae]